MARRSGSMSGRWRRGTGGYSGTGIPERAGYTHGLPKPPRHLPTLPNAVYASWIWWSALRFDHRLPFATPIGVDSPCVGLRGNFIPNLSGFLL